MKMKLFSSKENVKNTYEYLQKRRKYIKRRSLLLAIFVFGVNIYAWFTYVSKANLAIDANIIAWDINFLDNNDMIKDVDIVVDDLYPGMPTYTKSIKVTNSSDLKAEFEYKITEVTIQGKDSIPDDYDNEQIIKSLNSSYPFKINFNTTKQELDKNDSLEFKVSIDWDYESTDNNFYKLTEHYQYDSSVNYYIYKDNEYVVDDTITKSNFESRKLDLYLEKDDADSFWGTSCNEYVAKTKKSCINFKVVLSAKQTN